jgi:hypothetical protein
VLLFGLAVSWGMWRVWGQRFLVCPEGLVRTCRGKVERCRWEEIQEVRESAGKPGKRYEVVRKKGAAWTFDENTMTDGDRLAALLREHARRCGVTWREMKKEGGEG